MSRFNKRTLVMLSVIFSTMLAIATTYGPFSIAAAGPEFVNTTLAADQSAEWAGANKLATIYLSPALNTPAKIVEAMGFVRVVYIDGQIVDFKIARWPSAIPLDYSQTMKTINQPHLSDAALEDLDRRMSCIFTASGGYSVSYSTGYWGSNSELIDNGNTWVITSAWINTGTVSYWIPTFNKRCVYK